ncbi:MAG: integration host factor subunit beta [Deltaproteobacteria bacterium]|jgi:nucleoid DNA-binding protein|nr:integration host factor subunit beta [Deltaproteobacteria bacterium]
MLKRDLVEKTADSLDGYLKKDISQAVDIILETMTESLDQENRVEIRGFGSFSVRKRKARQTKNPKTGKVMDIPPRKTLHFAMSKSVKEALIDKK